MKEKAKATPRKLAPETVERCLLDAGFTPDAARTYVELSLRRDTYGERLQCLYAQRRALLAAAHKAEGGIDCVDYLLNELRQEQQA